MSEVAAVVKRDIIELMGRQTAKRNKTVFVAVRQAYSEKPKEKPKKGG